MDMTHQMDMTQQLQSELSIRQMWYIDVWIPLNPFTKYKSRKDKVHQECVNVCWNGKRVIILNFAEMYTNVPFRALISISSAAFGHINFSDLGKLTWSMAFHSFIDKLVVVALVLTLYLGYCHIILVDIKLTLPQKITKV